MSVRSKSQHPRCKQCGLHTQLCLCDEMARIPLKTRIIVVQHERETYKPTSTAGLLLHMFPNSERVVFGALNGNFDASPLAVPDRRYAVLFPRNDAARLDQTAPNTDLPDTLVVLDGTWSQCSRMSRRAEVVRDLPFAKLPPGPASPWSIRRSNDPARLCTFEATLRALAIVESPRPELVEAERAFQRVSARALFMRSRLPSPEPPADWPTPIFDRNDT